MKATKKLIAAGICTLAMFRCSNAYTPAETNRVLWQLVNIASPHVDSLDDLRRGVGCVDTRTPRKFFNLQVDGDWTPKEKKAAFDAFLEGMGRHDYSSETNDFQSVTELAVSQCAFMNYTVALPWIKELFLNPTCSHRVRMHTIRNMVPMLPLNTESRDFVENVFTNNVVFARKERGFLSGFYLGRMLEGATNGLCTASFVKESARRFYRHRKIDSAGGLMFDELFAEGIEGYSTSSNRLDFALFVLRNPGSNPYNREHFTDVTNQLLSSGIPLQQLAIGEGENE